MRIEVGYGLEGALTDATSRRIIAEDVAPKFRDNQFAAGHRRRRRPDHRDVVTRAQPLAATAAESGAARVRGGISISRRCSIILFVVGAGAGLASCARIFGQRARARRSAAGIVGVGRLVRRWARSLIAGVAGVVALRDHAVLGVGGTLSAAAAAMCIPTGGWRRGRIRRGRWRRRRLLGRRRQLRRRRRVGELVTVREPRARRLWRHLVTDHADGASRAFPTRRARAHRGRRSPRARARHRGQVCFAVEAALPHRRVCCAT